ncbi:MAG: hypothetical protein JSR56_14350 [Proteobacteria bacterium]|nr:hypothetical protein [Pseudomonadota bacterium]
MSGHVPDRCGVQFQAALRTGSAATRGARARRDPAPAAHYLCSEDRKNQLADL